MKRFRLSDRSRIHAVIEEHYQCASPVPTDTKRVAPPSRPLHLVSCKVECVDLHLGQVVPPCHVALWLLLLIVISIPTTL